MIDSSDVRAALERQERFAPDPAAVRGRVHHPRRTSRWPVLAAVAAAVVAVVVVVAVVRARSSAPLVGAPPVSSGSAMASTPAPTARSSSVPSPYVGIRWVLTSASIDGKVEVIPTSTGRPPQPVEPAVLELFPDGSSFLSGPACLKQHGRWRPLPAGFELIDQRRIAMLCYFIDDSSVYNAGNVLTAFTGPASVSVDSMQMTASSARVRAVFTNAGPASEPDTDIYSASTSSSSSSSR